jgi:hypothetical protein
MSDPSEIGVKKDFADRLVLGVSMTKEEVINAFLEQFPSSSREVVLDAFSELASAPDDAKFTSFRRRNRGRDAITCDIRKADGTLLGSMLVNAVTGQPLQRLG